MKPFLVSLFVLLFGLGLAADGVYQRGFLSIEEAHKSIELPEGFSLELMLSEPAIEEPVAMVWDGNGAMYVVEMRTYMQNIDADGEKAPTSRISKHVDTNGDGAYDQHHVFIDDLMLPRMVLPLDDRILVGVTDTLDLWTYRDTNGDGVADEKIKVHQGGSRGGNMEHQPSGLIWGLDNWIYLTYERVRYRFTDGELKVEALPKGGGQWGLTQDNYGRIYYSTAGGENPAFGFQQPPQYGMLKAPDETEPDFRVVYPSAPVPDVQGGARRVSEMGGLNHFTGCAGQGIFRGDRLPAALQNQLFIPEPVGRLVRFASVTRSNGRTVLGNATPGTEFIRSRDVNFRPLGAKTMPDGRMALLDMHRGIIQQGNWVGRGSYLRTVVQEWELDKNIGKGRIYRIVHKDHQAGSQPRMLDESTAELVAHLAHPNGWWRDTAQRMIVLRSDRDRVVPQLTSMAKQHANPLARLHALWTLEGIGAVTPALIEQALNDPDVHVQAAAIRNSEPFLKAGDTQVIDALLARQDSADAEVFLQLINSIDFANADSEALTSMAAALMDTHKEHPVVSAVEQNRKAVYQARLQREADAKRHAAFAKTMDQGRTVYQQLCFACHGADGKGAPMPGQKGVTLAPTLHRSPRVVGSGANMVRILLKGLSGPLDGKTFPGVMAPMESNSDEWLAAVSTYVRNSFGNDKLGGGEIKPAYIASMRASIADRTTMWTQAELEDLEPPLLTERQAWKLTASHNESGCDAAIDGDAKSRYTTRTPQTPGQWLQVELPEASRITRILLNSEGSSDDYPRGFEVVVSSDGKTWSDPVVSGTGTQGVTTLEFAPVDTRFVKITQTGQVGNKYWSIHELDIYGKPLASK